jgi:hypothetical protein
MVVPMNFDIKRYEQYFGLIDVIGLPVYFYKSYEMRKSQILKEQNNLYFVAE